MDETNCPCEKISPSIVNHIIIIVCDPKTQQTNSETYVRWSSSHMDQAIKFKGPSSCTWSSSHPNVRCMCKQSFKDH